MFRMSAMAFPMRDTMEPELRRAQTEIMVDMNIPTYNVTPSERLVRDQEYLRRMEKAIYNIKNPIHSVPSVRSFHSSGHSCVESHSSHSSHTGDVSTHSDAEVEIHELENEVEKELEKNTYKAFFMKHFGPLTKNVAKNAYDP